MAAKDTPNFEPMRGSIIFQLKDTSPVKMHMQQRLSGKFQMLGAGDGTSDTMFASRISNNRFGAKK